jgi:hypothetical protein
MHDTVMPDGVTSRYLVNGRMYCTYEYGLGGCSEGGAWENKLRPVTTG